MSEDTLRTAILRHILDTVNEVLETCPQEQADKQEEPEEQAETVFDAVSQ